MQKRMVKIFNLYLIHYNIDAKKLIKDIKQNNQAHCWVRKDHKLIKERNI